jgi:hypothetical protein
LLILDVLRREIDKSTGPVGSARPSKKGKNAPEFRCHKSATLKWQFPKKVRFYAAAPANGKGHLGK